MDKFSNLNVSIADSIYLGAIEFPFNPLYFYKYTFRRSGFFKEAIAGSINFGAIKIDIRIWIITKLT